MTLVIIPARMASTRLPGKPLLKIGDVTIIQRCFEQALKAGFLPFIATDSDEIKSMFGPRAILTGDCASGTDRVAAAAEIIDPEGKHEFVINYQGDMPFLDPELLKQFVDRREKYLDQNSILTAYCWQCHVMLLEGEFKRVLFQSHIGLYGYDRQALRRFAKLPQSDGEIAQSLEQLRSPLSFEWQHVEFPSIPIEINTQADLDRARSCLM